jgi:hypothetical protein
MNGMYMEQCNKQILTLLLRRLPRSLFTGVTATVDPTEPLLWLPATADMRLVLLFATMLLLLLLLLLVLLLLLTCSSAL